MMNNLMLKRRRQRGQSMSELLISMTVLLPIFLAITYAARYGDIQQRATQASRYAAFERARQPDTGRLSDAKIEDQMRARFFLAPTYKNQGRLRSDDTAANMTNDKGEPALWSDLRGQALLQSPQQARLTWADAKLGSGLGSAEGRAMAKLVGKPYRDTRVAQVEVSLVNRMDLSNANPNTLRLGATVAAAGDGLGSAGSQMTRDAASRLVPASRIPPALRGLLQQGIGLLEDKGPELGCIKPDVVPSHRLQGGANNSRCL
jgi:hypothetical protein